MNAWQFASEHPFAAVMAVWIVAHYAFQLCRLVTRSISILKSGWPPPHCDADGDSVFQEDDDDDRP